MMLNKIKIGSFSLAEMLITLAIMGVVACLVLPNLIKKYQNHANYVALKKYYSIMSTVYPLAVRENGTDSWKFSDGNLASSLGFIDYFTPYLKVVKTCQNTIGCWSKEITLALNGKKTVQGGNSIGIGTNIACAKMADGSNFCIDFWNGASYAKSYFGVDIREGSFGVMWFDVNGNKKPNELGRDVFSFVFDNEKMYPAGVHSNPHCDVSHTDTASGFTCAYKVLKEYGINY